MADREFIYLKSREFLTLLNGAGVARWYGPQIPDDGAVENSRDMNRILAGLYQKNVLEWDGGDAVITGETDAVIKVIRAADVCILACRKDGGSDLSYFYPAGDEVACINVSERDADTLRIAAMSFAEWIRQLEEEGYFPEQICPASGRPEPVSDEADAVMELHDMKTGEILKQIHILDNGGYGIMFLTEPDRRDLSVCSRAEYERILKQWTEVCS